MWLTFLWRHCIQKLYNIEYLFVWGKEYLRENCIYVSFFVSVEVRHRNKYLHFILKLPNCTAVACTNCLMKNSNCSFHKYVISGCKILRVKNSFLRTSISVLHILKKKSDGKYDHGFLCALKVHSQLLENFCNWKPLNDEKCFLFYLKSSFCSQDI